MFPSEVSKGRKLAQVVCTVFFGYVVCACLLIRNIYQSDSTQSHHCRGHIWICGAQACTLETRWVPTKSQLVSSNRPIGVYAGLCTEEEKESRVWVCAEQDLRMNFMFTLSTVVTNVNTSLASPTDLLTGHILKVRSFAHRGDP